MDAAEPERRGREKERGKKKESERDPETPELPVRQREGAGPSRGAWLAGAYGALQGAGPKCLLGAPKGVDDA